MICSPRGRAHLPAAALASCLALAACSGSSSKSHSASSSPSKTKQDGGAAGDTSGGSGGKSHNSGGNAGGNGNGGDGGRSMLDGAVGGGNGGADSGTVAPGTIIHTDYPCKGCKQFPSASAPSCKPTALAAVRIAYPPDGVLLPPNMNVLEVQFTESPGATLYEVDFANAITDVKVETKCEHVTPVRGGDSLGCGVTLSQAAWNDISHSNRAGDPLHITVRATKDGSCVSSSKTNVDINFADEDLAGGIYYWQSATYGGIGGTTGGIYSHDFGTLDPTPTPFYTSGATGTCVGCHSLSRDGERMALATDDPDADDEFGDVKTHVMDVAMRNVLGGAMMSPGFQTFTHDHAKMIASTFKTKKNQAFAVFDGDGAHLLATAMLPTGVLATQPDLSADDATLVYVVPQAGSISKAGDHHFMSGALYTSSFDASSNALGAPAALLTPSGSQTFYYPSFSPDSAFVIFNDAGADDAFYNRNARVKLLHYPPGSSPKAIDLPALNVADGLSNSWPRWSPFVQHYKGHALLWTTFSSNRDYGLHLVNKGFDNCYPPESPTYDQPQPLSKQGVGYEQCAQPQIWMAAVVVDADDAKVGSDDRSFPAFWLPFQDVTSHNHSAQWVEKIVTDQPQPDGGTPGGGAGGQTGGDAGTSHTCATAGMSCGSGCCSDVVCCLNVCRPACLQ